MGLFGTLMKAGLAKKAYDEARKPHNQRKIKDFVSSMQDKRRGRSSGPGPDTTPPR
jgi:dGTP triphosphohydrolase